MTAIYGYTVHAATVKENDQRERAMDGELTTSTIVCSVWPAEDKGARIGRSLPMATVEEKERVVTGGAYRYDSLHADEVVDVMDLANNMARLEGDEGCMWARAMATAALG